MKENIKNYIDQTGESDNYKNDKNTSGVPSAKNNSHKLNKTDFKFEINNDDDEEYAPPMNIVLVGTKLDLTVENKREVSFREGLNLAKNLNLAGFIETSAK